MSLWTTKRVAVLGLILAFALVLSWIENLFPFFFGVPGMKLGLPNFAVVLLLYLGPSGKKDGFSSNGATAALMVNVLRIVLSGFLFGSLFGICFSLAGAVASFVVMIFAKKAGCFGVTGVSVLGGVAHNVGQLLVAVFIVRTSGILYYMPALILSGAITGFVIGALTVAVLPYVRRAKEK